MTWRVIEGDCVEQMLAMEENSVDAVVTDPLSPYGLEFMGKEWDRFDRNGPASFEDTGGGPFVSYGRTAESGNFKDKPRWGTMGPRAMLAFQAWSQAWATEALRVLKPGGHLLAFGGTRTYHRLTCALEDAGFEIRDCLAWLYGSGFPKSLDVSKAIDKAAGAEREVVGLDPNHRDHVHSESVYEGGQTRPEFITAPATPDAERWQGWGTALKPAFEPIVLARKPLSERNVAANVLRWGTGALNVDGCRIEGEVPQVTQGAEDRIYGNGKGLRSEPTLSNPHASGRWPANVTLDEEAAAMLDEQTGETTSSDRLHPGRDAETAFGQIVSSARTVGYSDTGGASRFFYTAKAGSAERSRGVAEYLPDKAPEFAPTMGNGIGGKEHDPVTATPKRNVHPTVKPVDLMQWLCRLVTPPAGVVLDPFAGSGSTGIAALREGFSFIGIERDAEYVEIARARILGDAPLFNAGLEVVS